MKKTVKLNELAKELNNPETKFTSYVDYSQEANDGTENLQGLLVIKAETAVGCYWYNAYFNFDTKCEDAEDAFIVDEEQDFIDGLWGLEDENLNQIIVVDDEGQRVDMYEMPEGFPKAAHTPDFEALKKELNERH